MPKQKPGRLSVRWNKKEDDHLVRYPSGPDGHLAAHIFFGDRVVPNYEPDGPRVNFDPSFVKQLELRGYDLKTLRFQVDKKE